MHKHKIDYDEYLQELKEDMAERQRQDKLLSYNRQESETKYEEYKRELRTR